MPDTELRQTTHVVPFGQSKKLIVFGSRTGRRMVKDMLEKLDVEDAEKSSRKTFTLEHADAEEMAERIETLFSGLEVSYKSNWYTSYYRDRDAAKVTVVPDKRRNAITVITDPDTMAEIEALIKEEDTPVDPNEVKQQIYTLKYVDAGEMRDLLSEMFSAKEKSQGSFWDRYYGRSQDAQIKPVGRLMGQFTFQVLPSANKLIVNSKSVANYEVIDRLIKELDQPQQAGLPEIVELKFANAEDLCEQLNALLAEPSTLAKIQRAARGLSDVPRATGSATTGNKPGTSGSAPKQAKATAGEMPFWWQSFKPAAGQIPTSNLIGKIRIVPVYRRNALMVLSPEGFKDRILELIDTLDQPGRQVLIRARIGEIQHEDQTTLGLRIASDPSILGALDSAVLGGGSATYAEAFYGNTLTINANANISAMLNLLVREFDMQILLTPTITTSDNEASEYFDGQDLYVATGSTLSEEGGRTSTDIKARSVGTLLRVRPHVTQNKNVDLMVNLVISRIVPGSTSQNNPVFDRREVTTHVIVNDGQTIMLSGIIRQEKFEDVHKVPLLGDIPLLGKLFRSIDTGVRNRELVVFLTPHVMDTAEAIDAQMAKPRETLKQVEDALNGDDDKD